MHHRLVTSTPPPTNPLPSTTTYTPRTRRRRVVDSGRTYGPPFPSKNVNYPRPPSSRSGGLVGSHPTPPILDYKDMASTPREGYFDTAHARAMVICICSARKSVGHETNDRVMVHGDDTRAAGRRFRYQARINKIVWSGDGRAAGAHGSPRRRQCSPEGSGWTVRGPKRLKRAHIALRKGTGPGRARSASCRLQTRHIRTKI